MTKVNAKCPYCNEVVLTEEGLRYDECPKCKNIYETEKGLKLYREQLENKQSKPSTQHRTHGPNKVFCNLKEAQSKAE